MQTPALDAAEAARVTLTQAEALSRGAHRLVTATHLLEREAARFARELTEGQLSEGRGLLTRHGAMIEALDGISEAALTLEEALGHLRFPHQDTTANEATRARALGELRQLLERRKGTLPG